MERPSRKTATEIKEQTGARRRETLRCWSVEVIINRRDFGPALRFQMIRRGCQSIVSCANRLCVDAWTQARKGFL